MENNRPDSELKFSKNIFRFFFTINFGFSKTYTVILPATRILELS